MNKKKKLTSKCMRCNCTIYFETQSEAEWKNFTRSTLLCENCKRGKSYTEGMIIYF